MIKYMLLKTITQVFKPSTSELSKELDKLSYFRLNSKTPFLITLYVILIHIRI